MAENIAGDQHDYDQYDSRNQEMIVQNSALNLILGYIGNLSIGPFLDDYAVSKGNVNIITEEEDKLRTDLEEVMTQNPDIADQIESNSISRQEVADLLTKFRQQKLSQQKQEHSKKEHSDKESNEGQQSNEYKFKPQFSAHHHASSGFWRIFPMIGQGLLAPIFNIFSNPIIRKLFCRY